MCIEPLTARAHFFTQKQEPLIQWNQFNLSLGTSSDIVKEKFISSMAIAHTQISCALATETGQWENRCTFLEKTMQDILQNHPIKEPLILLSIGSDHLLMEYILGKSLIKRGYHISFILIDPSYRFAPAESLHWCQTSLRDFRTYIEKAHLDTHGTHYPTENIRYLSTVNNIDKYLPLGAHVAVIEALPPNAEAIKHIQEAGCIEEHPDRLMFGGCIVPKQHANAISFLHPNQAKSLKELGYSEEYLLLTTFEAPERCQYYLNWVVKVEPSGNYHISFSGVEEYLSSFQMPLKEYKKIQHIYTGMEKSIKTAIKTLIKRMQASHPFDPLTQKEITEILETAERIVLEVEPNMVCRFSRDYALDRKKALKTVHSLASCHYSKIFTLKASSSQPYEIHIENIGSYPLDR